MYYHSRGGGVSFRITVVIDCEPKIKQGQVAALERFGRMLSTGKGSDFEFVVQGTVIPAHSFIIEESSPVLTAMFQHDMQEASNRSVKVQDIEPDVFRQLLHYVYTGDAPDLENEEMTEPLYIAADKYQIISLKEWCSTELSDKITVDNAVRLLAVAHLHSDEKLKQICAYFIATHKKIFWKRDDFKLLPKNYPDLFFEIAKLMNE